MTEIITHKIIDHENIDHENIDVMSSPIFYANFFNKDLSIHNKSGVVYLQGRVGINMLSCPTQKNMNDKTIFVLPVHLRPCKRLVFLCEGPSRIDVLSDGRVVVVNFNSSASNDNSNNNCNNCINLTGICFPTQRSNIEIHNLELFSGWRSLGGEYQEPSYFIQNGLVYLMGVMTGGVVQAHFAMLPSALRPTHRIPFAVCCGKNMDGQYKARVDIEPMGWCRIYSNGFFNRDLHSLSNISFPIASLSRGVGTIPPLSTNLHRTVDNNMISYKTSYEIPNVYQKNGLVSLGGVLFKNMPWCISGRIDLFKLGKNVAPKKKLHFHSHDFKFGPKLFKVIVDTNGDVYLDLPEEDYIQHTLMVSLSNISYVL